MRRWFAGTLIMVTLFLTGAALVARGQSGGGPSSGGEPSGAESANNKDRPEPPALETGAQSADRPDGQSAPAHVNPPPAPAPISIDRQPYRVQVRIAFENAPRFTAAIRSAVLKNVAEGLERYIGPLWDCHVIEERGELFSSPRALARLRKEVLGRAAIPEEINKVYLLALEWRGAGFAVAGREWDPLTRQLGPQVRHEPVYDSREVAESLLALTHDLFRPLAALEQTRSAPPVLRARAGDFIPPDPGWQVVAPERAFELFYCYLTPAKTIDRVVQVPWTYLAVTDVDRGLAHVAASSGLRSALVARRRVQSLALGITRRSASTKLKLVTRPPARQPLAGVEVEVEPPLQPHADEAEVGEASQSPEDAAPPAKPAVFVADRNGVVHLSAELAPAGKPVWLTVRSGQALMARVPFLPGVHAEEVLELGDDSLRLETEANLALLQAELVDTVARRAVLISLARSRAGADKWDEVAALLKEIDAMRKAQSFMGELNAIRIPAIKAARVARDRTAELRIDKLCAETSELVTNYLDEEKVRELKDEVHELQTAAQDEAEAQAKFQRLDAKSSGPESDQGEKTKAEPKKKKKVKRPAAVPQRPAQAPPSF